MISYYVVYAKPDGTLVLEKFDSLKAARDFAADHSLGALVLEVRDGKLMIRDNIEPYSLGDNP